MDRPRRGGAVPTEDDDAKQRVQEAVWTWAVRLLVLAVTFGFGYFAGYVNYGSGETGSVFLRKHVTDLDAQLLDCKNKRVDVDGKLTVIQTRLDECTKNLTKAVNAATAKPAE